MGCDSEALWESLRCDDSEIKVFSVNLRTKHFYVNCKYICHDLDYSCLTNGL